MIFVRWDASVFDCLAKYSGKQLRSRLPSFSWQHQGLWRQELPLVVEVQPSHLQARVSQVLLMFMRRKYFQIIFRGEKKKKNQ